uniref:Pleckstrin-like plant domain-containing protein n=1 Tax=Oryza brachyantha TaxID=4533 RepID=J3NES5_ORYBR
MDRIMSQSDSSSLQIGTLNLCLANFTCFMEQQEVSPLTSGRLSHSSGPLNGGGGSLPDSPPVSPDVDDSKALALSAADQEEVFDLMVFGVCLVCEKKLFFILATISVLVVSCFHKQAPLQDCNMFSAPTLHCHLWVKSSRKLLAWGLMLMASMIMSCCVPPHDMLALRGAATLKARALKDVWNVAAVIPVEKNAITGGNGHHHHHKHNSQKRQHHHHHGGSNTSSSVSDDLAVDDDTNNFLSICSQELLARGTELLKRTRKGALHWKVVSVYIHRTGAVMLKMKSRHVAGTITKKKKSKCSTTTIHVWRGHGCFVLRVTNNGGVVVGADVVVDVCRDVAAWPGRHLLEGGEHRRYFGLRTAEHRVIEFECSSQREYDMWTKGVARLLAAVADGRKRFA